MNTNYDRDRLCGEDVTPQEQEWLVRLMEEAAEVQQAAAKVLRWGWECWHPDDASHRTNRRALADELADLSAMAVRLGLEARPAAVSADQDFWSRTVRAVVEATAKWPDEAPLDQYLRLARDDLVVCIERIAAALWAAEFAAGGEK